MDRDNPHVTEAELNTAVKAIRRGKAAGMDGMTSSVLRDLCNVRAFFTLLHLFVNVCLHIGYWPT